MAKKAFGNRESSFNQRNELLNTQEGAIKIERQRVL